MRVATRKIFRLFLNRLKVVQIVFAFSLAVAASSGFAAENEAAPFGYTIGFQQNLNSYRWLSNMHYTRSLYGKGFFSATENFNSTLLRLNQDNHKWKDDHQFNLKLFWPFNPLLGIKSSASVYNFSDRLSGYVSDINTNWWDLGLVLRPLPSVQLNASAGYKYDSRFSKIDRGSTYHLDLKTEPIVVKDYANQFSFLSRGDQFTIRRNNDLNLNYRVKKYFLENTYDSLSVFWTKTRRDNYDQLTQAQLLIESLEENMRGVEHELGYGLSKSIRLKFRTVLSNRQTRVGKYHEERQLDSRSKKEVHSENEIGTFIQQPKLAAKLALGYVTDNQKNDVPDSLKSSKFSKYFYYISPDFNSSRLTLSGAMRYSLTRSDTLNVNGSTSIYRYDTPDNNMDDRDEFRMNFKVSETHYFNENLKLIFNSSVNLYHLVYIYSERSANNNWMRIFRIDPQVVYRPTSRITLFNHAEVLANYVDYDYEDGSSATDIKSYVFRRFSIDHQSTYQLTQRTRLFFSYNLEIEENGKLNWDHWTEILLNNRESHWIRGNVSFNVKGKFMIAPGVIYFKRNEKQADTLPVSYLGSLQGGDIESVGPTLKLSYQSGDRLNFSFEGMRRSESGSFEERRYINHFDVSLTWYN
ncbi:MAG: hypothetical protein ACOY90_02930 [Candidatus Zhuqueibacterota bacterium]